MWIDCHAHIDNLSESEQRQVLSRAREAGVRWLINAADNEDSCRRILDLVDRCPQVYGCLGIHPHHAKDVTEETYRLVEQAFNSSRRGKVIAVGEIGLDFYYENSPRNIQMKVFERFLELALGKGLPVVVHQRACQDEIIVSLRKFCVRGLKGMMHCFGGTWTNARELLDMGLYLSFSGLITFPKASDVREVAQKVPADRVMLETDSPYLSPVPLRGQTNEPKNLPTIAACLADLRKVKQEDLSAQIMKNCSTLFGLELR